jgi:hypothetical protein
MWRRMGSKTLTTKDTKVHAGNQSWIGLLFSNGDAEFPGWTGETHVVHKLKGARGAPVTFSG